MTDKTTYQKIYPREFKWKISATIWDLLYGTCEIIKFTITVIRNKKKMDRENTFKLDESEMRRRSKKDTDGV